ncbi:39S ribosomal protein L23, mitochondrial [Biomphalaria glabrata]|nr:39S ribosomal protein L23, mitochondrial [Biomphalaria glabrata]
MLIKLIKLYFRPLYRRRIPKYPIFWKGDPQIRVFLPQFWMRLIKPDYDIPSNQVHFEVHIQMSDLDIKNYLEKIYKVPVLSVQTEIIRAIISTNFSAIIHLKSQLSSTNFSVIIHLKSQLSSTNFSVIIY